MKRYCTLFYLIILCLYASSQDTDIQLENMIYNNDIRSVKLNIVGNSLSFPVITLNTDEQLELSFDDMNSERKYVRYNFIHCTYDWQRSDLARIEYAEGFEDGEISDYTSSFNTIIPYTHYTLNFPNDEIKLTKSGNYILLVYDETEDKPILTRRFFIKENTSSSITASIHKDSNPEFTFTRQEVDFVVNTNSYAVPNPQRDLHASIIQNSRWDNAIIGLTYRSGANGTYSFNFDDGRNCFWGGSSFRYFSIRSLRSNREFVQNIVYKNHQNYVYLYAEKPKPYNAYEENNSLYGHCFFINDDMDQDNSEDYVWVNFALRDDIEWQDGDVYIFGELTDYRFLPEAKLKYNNNSHLWETNLFLKQGYYNYQFLFLPQGKTKGLESVIEGNHWETKNEYNIIVYLREESTLYDKIIQVITTYTLDN